MISPQQTALLIIDMLYGFVEPDSPLCIAGAAQTVDACARVLSKAREISMPVVHITRDYASDGSDIEAVRWALWASAGKPLSLDCAQVNSAEEIAPLGPCAGEYCIVKPRFSAFFATKLDLLLRRLGVTSVVLMGTTTPNCIRTTCYDALSLDYNVAVLQDCTSSRTPEVQAANIEDMRVIGAHIFSSEEFLQHDVSLVPDVVGDMRAEMLEFARED